MTTLALVEIGTRAVRLLVATRGEKSGIRIVGTGVEDNPLNAQTTKLGLDGRAQIMGDELRSTIDRLLVPGLASPD